MMPLSWILTGRDVESDVLDRRSFDKFEKSENFYIHFTFQNLVKPYQTFILTQESNNQQENNQFALYGIEFYGLLHSLK